PLAEHECAEEQECPDRPADGGGDCHDDQQLVLERRTKPRGFGPPIRLVIGDLDALCGFDSFDLELRLLLVLEAPRLLRIGLATGEKNCGKEDESDFRVHGVLRSGCIRSSAMTSPVVMLCGITWLPALFLDKITAITTKTSRKPRAMNEARSDIPYSAGFDESRLDR